MSIVAISVEAINIQKVLVYCWAGQQGLICDKKYKILRACLYIILYGSVCVSEKNTNWTV